VTCGLGKINLIASYQFGRFHKELLISCYPTTSKSQTLSLLTGHKSSSFFIYLRPFLSNHAIELVIYDIFADDIMLLISKHPLLD